MKIIGGAASSENELILLSDNFEAKAKLNKKTNEIEISDNPQNIKGNVLFKIPIIRGIYVYFKQYLFSQEKFGLELLHVGLIVFCVINIFIPNVKPDYFYYAYVLMIVIVMKINNISKLHGAEHTIYNYYKKFGSISEWNYEDLKKESRIVNHCGTTQYILIIIFLFIQSFFIGNFIIRYLISISISYEIMYDPDNKIVNILLKPLFLLSGIIQKYLFTAKPENIHIDMGIKLVLKLQELESEKEKNAEI